MVVCWPASSRHTNKRHTVISFRHFWCRSKGDQQRQVHYNNSLHGPRRWPKSHLLSVSNHPHPSRLNRRTALLRTKKSAPWSELNRTHVQNVANSMGEWVSGWLTVSGKWVSATNCCLSGLLDFLLLSSKFQPASQPGTGKQLKVVSVMMIFRWEWWLFPIYILLVCATRTICDGRLVGPLLVLVDDREWRVVAFHSQPVECVWRWRSERYASKYVSTECCY